MAADCRSNSRTTTCQQHIRDYKLDLVFEASVVNQDLDQIRMQADKRNYEKNNEKT